MSIRVTFKILKPNSSGILGKVRCIIKKHPDETQRDVGLRLNYIKRVMEKRARNKYNLPVTVQLDHLYEIRDNGKVKKEAR